MSLSEFLILEMWACFKTNVFENMFFVASKQNKTCCFCKKKTEHCYFLFLFSDIWEETGGDESDDDDKTDESMPPDENDD